VEALVKLVGGLPSNLRAAVFIVVHLAPASPGFLPGILSRAGALPARHARDGERIEHGTIYVAPPDHHLFVSASTVRVSHGPRENRHRPAVDVLFRSAAEAFGWRTIGLILSGSLDDGALGLQAIKSRGGIALVQDPKEAIFSSMPEAALRYTAVDEVLPLRRIASRLVQWTETEAEEPHVKVGPGLASNSNPSKATMTPNKMTQNFGEPSAFACPECNGPLWEVKNGQLVHFRCLVGHSYSPESLLESDGEALERALWSAIRTLEQRSALLKRLALQTRLARQHHSAAGFDERASDCDAQARIIRSLVERVSQKKASGAKIRRRPRRARERAKSRMR
jgi:two-component system chemotaxis response regulator CheB